MIEVFDVEEPTLIYRTDFVSGSKQCGKQVFIDRFSFSETKINDEDRDNLESQTTDEKYTSKGYVISVSESSVPHALVFMILEPCSHIFWSDVYSDDKLNQIEQRCERQAFVKVL